MFSGTTLVSSEGGLLLSAAVCCGDDGGVLGLGGACCFLLGWAVGLPGGLAGFGELPAIVFLVLVVAEDFPSPLVLSSSSSIGRITIGIRRLAGFFTVTFTSSSPPLFPSPPSPVADLTSLAKVFPSLVPVFCSLATVILRLATGWLTPSPLHFSCAVTFEPN